MSDHRILSEQNQYYIPKETFLMLTHYCKQYPQWVDELNAMTDTSKAIRYDGDRVQTSMDGDPTSDLAMRRAEISRKKEMVDEVIELVAGHVNLNKWLQLGVCHDYTYFQLHELGLPCGRRYYYEMRRRFYWEMSRRV